MIYDIALTRFGLTDAALLRKMQEAVEMHAEHVGNFLDFSDSLPATIVQQFYGLVLQWESGSSEQNPYEAKVEAISVKRIRLELAQEEASAVERDKELLMHDTVSPSILITQGLELQDQQAHLKIDDQAVVLIQPKSSVLTFWSVATVSCAESHRGNPFKNSTFQALDSTDIARRPGEAPRHLRRGGNQPFPSVSCDTKLAEYEWRLRYAIAHDLLSELRRQLLILGTMYQSKDRYVRGQEHNTRSITLIKNVQSQINYAATRYRSNRDALLSLSTFLNKSGWETTLRVLADTDLRGLKEGEDASGSEGRRTLSWIWMTQRENKTEMTESMSEGDYRYHLS
ncbi:hypothetical protein IMY05_C1152001600 [Salix suchowensis]|nr:hypothetical protein IMY05_C1152001600 [Salix suchowensis]